MSRSSHPLFARVYDRRSRALEDKGVREHREALLSGLSGRVLEIGAGNGLNLPHYPPGVRVVAVEPDPYLLARASRLVHRCVATVTLVEGDACCLPLGDESVDAVVCSLVLCSVPSVPAALCELRRVLRHGGVVRFYEHVVAASPRRRCAQRWLNPVWRRLVGGCNLTRDTAHAISAAGFEMRRCTTFQFQPTLSSVLTSTHIAGCARR